MSSTVQTATEIRPFHVEFPEEALGELRDRIAARAGPVRSSSPIARRVFS